MRNKLLGIVFLCVIMLVPLITIADRSFFNKDAETGNTAEISPIAAVGEFLDDIPFRKSLAKFNTKLTRNITNNMYINSTQVMLGKNDWLFLRETKQDFEHVNCFTESEKEQITKQLLKLKGLLAESGIEFVIYIAPNKATIYPEYMPETIFQRDSVSRAEDLIEYIRANSDIKVIDPKKELLEAKELATIYYTSDTHWNELGGYVGAQVLLRELFGFEDKLTADKIVSYEGSRDGDLAKIGNITDIYKDTLLYEVPFEKLDSSFYSDKKIYCIGDSFWEAMEKYMPLYIKESKYVHFSELDCMNLFEYEPDIVVWELVERSLDMYLDYDYVDNELYDSVISRLYKASDGKTYFMPPTFVIDEDGVRCYKNEEYATDKLIIEGGTVYYFDKSGHMLMDSYKDIGEYTYYFSASGRACQGWLESGDDWYYFDNEFHMVKNNWIQSESGLWYYMTEDGTMLTDAYTPDGYYVDKSGVWVK